MSHQTMSKPRWFTAHFGIRKPQYELPFIDFDLNADVPLYIDPYAITQDGSLLGARCHDAIVSYFQALLDAVRAHDDRYVRYLLSGRLAEPKEIHLGVGKRARSGAGIGPLQESQIIEALTGSQALKTGSIQSIQELELHIEGIGPDKISDLVGNIIKGQLAEFTSWVCGQYGIPSRHSAVNACWDTEHLTWRGCYHRLPVRGTDAYILVPKQFVRLEKDTVNHRDFYEHYVLDVLEREMLTANDSLVQTLKNGRRRVTKRSLREDARFRPTKAFISEFIQMHPETISRYRGDVSRRFAPVDPAEFSGKSLEDDPGIHAALDSLAELPTGAAYASAYQNTVLRLVEFVFDWCLRSFAKEYPMDQGRGRIDIICDNHAGVGLFAELKTELQATSIPIECKNYSTDLGNEEFNQLNDRLGDASSRLGFIFCRGVSDRRAMSRHVTNRWTRQRNMILVFDDKQLTRLARLRLARDFQGIEAIVREMVRHVKFGNPGE